MIKSKDEFISYIGKRLDLYALNKDAVEKMQKYMMDKYNFRLSEAADLITQKSPLTTENVYVCFCVADALAQIDNRVKLEEWFTDKEISIFSSETIQRDKFKFPITIPAVQITDDQWIGTCDCDFLMKLREAQKIYYNTNTQRTLQRIVKNGQESYRIMLNRTAVQEIKTAYDNETYIPDTISLNMPDDTEFWYNAEKREIVIESLDHFDIIDGFHRYTAMCMEKDANPDFNYPMELRIVQYDEIKAKQFIWQQDQKTKMKKLDSESLNVSAPENIVAEKLNRNPMFNLHGELNRNGGKIALQDFVNVVRFLYFKGVKKEDERKLINAVTNDLFNKLNYVSDNDDKIFSEALSRTDIIALVTSCYINNDLSKIKDGYLRAKDKIAEDKAFRQKLVAGINKPRIDKVISAIEGK